MLHDPETNYYIGLFLMEQKRYDEAAQAFQIATGDPKYFDRSKPYIDVIRQRLLGPLYPGPIAR
jgi:hypothetical protein